MSEGFSLTEIMTTPPTTVHVNGTLDGVSGTEATSVDGEQDLSQSQVTQRYHLEHLAPLASRDGDRLRSAESFNSSVDRIVTGPLSSSSINLSDRSQEQERREEESHRSHPVQQDHQNIDGIHSPPDLPTPSQTNIPAPTPLPHRRPHSREVIIHQPLIRNQSTHPEQQPSTSNPTPFLNLPSATTPPTPSPHPSTSTPSLPTPATQPLPSRQPLGTDHRWRRRLLRWLRHPLPWRVDIRRRTENIRRSIRNVERLLP